MEIRNLGRSGLRVSVVGLGCNNFGARLRTACVAMAALQDQLNVDLREAIGVEERTST